MKLWRMIWAIYVLVLSGLPCDTFCPDEHAPAADQVSLPAPPDHPFDDEGCSPFCLCATCPGFALPHSLRVPAVAIPTAPVLVAVLPSYQAPYTPDVPGRIWQPPRFG